MGLIGIEGGLMNMYARLPNGTAGGLLGSGDTLADLTAVHHGSRHGQISVIEGIGGTRHHRMVWADGRSDHPAHLLVLLPGDTNFPDDAR